MSKKGNTIERHQGPIVLVDGFCVLCCRAVDFILRVESDRELYFGSLQSKDVKDFLAHKKEVMVDSIVCVVNQKIITHSDAIIEIASHLKWPFSLAVYIRWLPKVWRDSAYNFIAKHRYNWFGKRDTCRLPQKHKLERVFS